MNTTITIPDHLYKNAEAIAKRENKSPNELLSDALQEYIDRRSTSQITNTVNKVCNDVNTSSDEFLSHAARKILEENEW